MEHVLITMQVSYSPIYECMCLHVAIDDRRIDVGDPLRTIARFRIELPTDDSNVNVANSLKYLYDALRISTWNVQERMNIAMMNLPNGETTSLYEM